MTRLPDPRERPWLTVAEVAEITGEGQKAIRSAVAAGHLPSLPIGRYVRIPTYQLYQLCGISPDMRTAEPASPAVATSPAHRQEGEVVRLHDAPTSVG